MRFHTVGREELPLQACMVLRLEAEEVTQYTDDLDADAKRDLLACLLQSVDEVLMFFRTVSWSTF